MTPHLIRPSKPTSKPDEHHLGTGYRSDAPSFNLMHAIPIVDLQSSVYLDGLFLSVDGFELTHILFPFGIPTPLKDLNFLMIDQ